MNILVLCTGNSCRSQIAEAWLRHFAREGAEIYSAGVEVHGLNPGAVATMKEAGIDISGYKSKHVDSLQHIPFDHIITVCDHARESCPYIPGAALRHHRDFPDPAKFKGTVEETKAEFARVRDMIRDYCREFVEKELELTSS